MGKGDANRRAAFRLAGSLREAIFRAKYEHREIRRGASVNNLPQEAPQGPSQPRFI